MTHRGGMVLGLIVAIALVSACQRASEAPTPTPDQESIAAASTLFAQPTRAPRVTPTPTSVNALDVALSRSIARMEQAVLAGDLEGYMAYVWPGDPVFWADHRGWASDWVAHPLESFTIDLFSIEALAPDLASARMATRWRLAGSAEDGSAGGATVSALFRREGDRWLLAGERWQTVDLTGMRFYYFADAVIDNTAQAQVILEYLPSVYTGLTVELDYTPPQTAHIKLYERAVTLQNWTRISHTGLQRWNVPGESIKIAVTENNTAPRETDVARELTRYFLYQMSGGMAGRLPWWLEAGVVEFGGARFGTFSQRNRTLKEIAALTLEPPASPDQLFAWADLLAAPQVFPERYQVALDQCYTLLHYVTETYGRDARNAWIKAVAGGVPVAQAAEQHLGVNLEALDSAWRAWLATQL